MTSDFVMTGQDVFGRYCKIEMKRHGVQNEFFIHKCIQRYRSNAYVDVPIQEPPKKRLHDESVDVVSVITCGVCETNVFAVPLDAVEFLPAPERTCHDIKPQKPFFECDVCGMEDMGGREIWISDGFYRSQKPNYCPNCGAKVVEQ